LFRFLTKKIHENTPTVRINSAAAAIVMPAICAIVRFSFPDIETPSGPALTEAWVIAVEDTGGELGAAVAETLVAAAADVECANVLGCNVGVGICVAGTAPETPEQIAEIELVFDCGIDEQFDD
jgi:hypothetical protein